MTLNAFLLLTSLFSSKIGEVTDHLLHRVVRISTAMQKQKVDDFVVLPLSKMWGDDFKGYSTGKLTSDDFNTINAQLKLFAEEYNKQEGKRQQEWIKRIPVLKYQKTDYSIKLINYKRQYICGINKRGDKEVWVNCFCKDDVQFLKYWKEQVVVVMDGGKCFFNLKINLTKRTKYGIMVNGIA